MTNRRTIALGAASATAAAGAEAILFAGLGAALLSQVFDRVLPQPPAPPGHKHKRKPVFPSGHAFGPSSVGWTTAYVFSREGRIQAGWAAVPAVLYSAV